MSYTHEIFGESRATASIDQYGAILIDIGDLHRGTLHLTISEAHLQMNVID